MYIVVTHSYFYVMCRIGYLTHTMCVILFVLLLNFSKVRFYGFCGQNQRRRERERERESEKHMQLKSLSCMHILLYCSCTVVQTDCLNNWLIDVVEFLKKCFFFLLFLKIKFLTTIILSTTTMKMAYWKGWINIFY